MKKSYVVLIIFLFILLACGAIMFVNPTLKDVPDEIKVQANSEFNIISPQAFYFFANISDEVNISSNVDVTKIGKYNIKYKINTLHGDYIKTQVVNVVDEEAPVITLEGNQKTSQSYGMDFLEPRLQCCRRL